MTYGNITHKNWIQKLSYNKIEDMDVLLKNSMSQYVNGKGVF